jgi:hypothetical protein
MKLPAVAIATAFGGGIALGLHPLVVPHVTSRFFLATCFAASLVLMVAGLSFASSARLLLAAVLPLFGLGSPWIFGSLRRGAAAARESRNVSSGNTTSLRKMRQQRCARVYSSHASPKTKRPQPWRRRQIKNRAAIRSRKPRAACHS